MMIKCNMYYTDEEIENFIAMGDVPKSERMMMQLLLEIKLSLSK